LTLAIGTVEMNMKRNVALAEYICSEALPALSLPDWLWLAPIQQPKESDGYIN